MDYVKDWFDGIYRSIQSYKPFNIPFIKKSIINRLLFKFFAEFKSNNSITFQDPKDIQYVFSYYSFSINEFTDFTAHTWFDEFDLNKNGILEKDKISEINYKVNSLKIW